jgi:hypothetical protein
MKLLIKLLLLTLVLNAIEGCGQTTSKTQKPMETINTDDKSQVLEVTRQLTQLMIDKNTLAMDKILDSNFSLTHITGYVQPKEEWVSEIESERMKYYGYNEVKTTVTINGDHATFVGQNILDARIWGTRNNWPLQQTMQLEKRNGKWIILKSVATTF